MKKFFSRKLLVAAITVICNILIATGNIPEETKPLILQLVTAIGGIYIIVQGIVDSLKKG